MKKCLFAVILVSIGLQASFAQKKAEWKEMDDFHTIMAKTFHPSEDNNLQPVKDNAGKLVKQAEEWAASTAPEGYNGKVTSEILKRLIVKCKELEAAVNEKKKNDDLKRIISEAHDIFHEIMEKCRKGEDTGHEHHDGEDHHH